MDLPSTQEVTPDKILHQITPPHKQILHPDVSPDSTPTPKTLTADRLEALLQMQKTESILQMHIKAFIKWQSTTT